MSRLRQVLLGVLAGAIVALAILAIFVVDRGPAPAPPAPPPVSGPTTAEIEAVAEEREARNRALEHEKAVIELQPETEVRAELLRAREVRKAEQYAREAAEAP